jgi:hypothetical protein
VTLPQAEKLRSMKSKPVLYAHMGINVFDRSRSLNAIKITKSIFENCRDAAQPEKLRSTKSKPESSVKKVRDRSYPDTSPPPPS